MELFVCVSLSLTARYLARWTDGRMDEIEMTRQDFLATQWEKRKGSFLIFEYRVTFVAMSIESTIFSRLKRSLTISISFVINL